MEHKEPGIAGTRYRLPFASGIKTGVLLGTSDHSEFDPMRIKPVLERLDKQAILGEHMLALARWMSDYYLQPPGEGVFQCIPGYLRGARQHHPLRVKRWRLQEIDTGLIDELKQRSSPPVRNLPGATSATIGADRSGPETDQPELASGGEGVAGEENSILGVD